MEQWSDPERQPLLSSSQDCRHRRRALNSLEVESAQRHGWGRARCLLLLTFWAVMTATVTVVACILMSMRSCADNPVPSVPPVHLSFTPLVQAL